MTRIALALAAVAAIACTPVIEGACETPRTAPSASDAPFVVLGDTQRTFWAESIIREQNETERRALVGQIVGERPSEIVHLGDMVVYGALESEWRYFDALMSPLTCSGVTVHPVLGNHDYWGEDAGDHPILNARRRFPELARNTFYVRQRGALGLILLDSNLRGRSAQIQRDWLRLMLGVLKRKRGIRAVIAFTHHPPYTLGKGRSSDGYVKSTLLPVLKSSHKFVAMLSGHVHGYERFSVGGRQFVVSGGGGGPRVEYRASLPSEPRPAFVPSKDPTAKRPFNYVVVRSGSDSIDFTVRCLQGSNCPKSGVLDRFSVPYPVPETSTTLSAGASGIEIRETARRD